MKVLILSCFTLLLTVGGSWTPLRAQEAELLDRFSFTFGGFFTSVNTDLRADAREGGLGDRLDLENELNLGESETLLRLSAELRIKRRHQVRLGFYRLSRTSPTRTITREIEFAGRTFPVSADVNVFFESEVLELSYTYWLLLKEKVAFGISAGGVNFFTFDAGLQAEDANLGIIDATAGTDIPLPLFGVEVRYAFAPKWMLRGAGRFIAVSNIEDYSGDSVDLTVAVEHRTFEHFGFGVSLSFVTLNVDAERRLFRGDLEYRISGLQVFGRVRY